MAYYQTTLNKYFIRDLQLLGEKDAIEAIKILKKRVSALRNENYYLSIPVTEFIFPKRVATALLNEDINTVGEIIEYGVDRLISIPVIGDKSFTRVKDIMQKIFVRKDEIRGLTGLDLYKALHKIGQ